MQHGASRNGASGLYEISSGHHDNIISSVFPVRAP
jgi:hypothetical protein